MLNGTHIGEHILLPARKSTFYLIYHCSCIETPSPLSVTWKLLKLIYCTVK